MTIDNEVGTPTKIITGQIGFGSFCSEMDHSTPDARKALWRHFGASWCAQASEYQVVSRYELWFPEKAASIAESARKHRAEQALLAHVQDALMRGYAP